MNELEVGGNKAVDLDAQESKVSNNLEFFITYPEDERSTSDQRIRTLAYLGMMSASLLGGQIIYEMRAADYFSDIYYNTSDEFLKNMSVISQYYGSNLVYSIALASGALWLDKIVYHSSSLESGSAAAISVFRSIFVLSFVLSFLEYGPFGNHLRDFGDVIFPLLFTSSIIIVNKMTEYDNFQKKYRSNLIEEDNLELEG